MIDEDLPRPDRRQALIVAAHGRIASGGLEGLRTRDVAGDVGVNVATLHYYFPTKEDLIRAVVERATGRFSAAMPGPGEPLDQLRDHLGRVRQLLLEEPDLFVVLWEVTMRAQRDPGIAAAMRAIGGHWGDMLQTLLRRAGFPEPEDMAEAVMAVMRGTGLPAPSPAREEQIDRTFRQLERWLGLS